jgi:hypothetical protein
MTYRFGDLVCVTLPQYLWNNPYVVTNVYTTTDGTTLMVRSEHGTTMFVSDKDVVPQEEYGR